MATPVSQDDPARLHRLEGNPARNPVVRQGYSVEDQQADQDILAFDGSIERRICVDCKEAKPLTEFQNTPKKGNKSKDCKRCRRAKFEAGMAARNRATTKPATKAWVIEQATILYDRAQKDSDKAKYLDLISRNLNDDAKTLTDDATLIKAIIASKHRQKELGR